MMIKSNKEKAAASEFQYEELREKRTQLISWIILNLTGPVPYQELREEIKNRSITLTVIWSNSLT